MLFADWFWIYIALCYLFCTLVLLTEGEGIKHPIVMFVLSPVVFTTYILSWIPWVYEKMKYFEESQKTRGL